MTDAMSRLLRVGRSRTGLGLFAVRPIKKRTIFIEYKGPRISNAKAEELERKNARYMYEINSRWTVNGAARSNIARYGNHSCRPNAESDVLYGKRAEGRKGGKVILRAIKNIEPGDEITYDYGKDYWEAFIKPIGCKCTPCINKRKKLRAEERAERLRKQKRQAAAAKRAAGTRKTAAETVRGSKNAKTKAGSVRTDRPAGSGLAGRTANRHSAAKSSKAKSRTAAKGSSAKSRAAKTGTAKSRTAKARRSA